MQSPHGWHKADGGLISAQFLEVGVEVCRMPEKDHKEWFSVPAVGAFA